jgi:hypothetical protein
VAKLNSGCHGWKFISHLLNAEANDIGNNAFAFALRQQTATRISRENLNLLIELSDYTNHEQVP